MKPCLPQAYAYVLPISRLHFERIRHDGKSTVVKFLSRPRMATRFGTGTIIMFYQTYGQSLIVGRGCVKAASMMTPADALKRYSESLVLTRSEMATYVHKFPNREKKELLVLELEQIIIYDRPVPWRHGMTMVGRFLDKAQDMACLKGPLGYQ